MHTDFTLDKRMESFYTNLQRGNKLTVKRDCYQCDGKGFYEYYDPIFDSRDRSEEATPPLERVECDQCNKGQIILVFNSTRELENWVEKKLRYQDWTFDYSEDAEVRKREYFYWSMMQELLWILPNEIATHLLNKYQNGIAEHRITINLYTQKMPCPYKLIASYQISKLENFGHQPQRSDVMNVTPTLTEEEILWLHNVLIKHKSDFLQFARDNFFVGIETEAYQQKVEALEKKLLAFADREAG